MRGFSLSDLFLRTVTEVHMSGQWGSLQKLEKKGKHAKELHDQMILSRNDGEDVLFRNRKKGQNMRGCSVGTNEFEDES